jgi:NADP-dependent 3-hydroxy acid dehydrogenase YdfG
MTQSKPKPVVVITGGLSGIGAATAVEFGREGARLVLGDRDLTRSGAVIAEIESAGGTGIAIEVDVRDAAALESLAATACEHFGGIDILVANAGIADQSSAAGGDPARWRAVVETNLLGTLYSVRAVLPALIERGGGHIFVLASVSGRETYVGEPAYIASKWGQVGYAHALRQEALEHGIRVSLVEPGLVDTPLARSNPKVKDALESIDALSPEDVARAIVYAWHQPEHVLLSEITLRPLRQRPF